jgi:predicted RNA-binding Zn ribbon-like protein
MLVLDFVNTLDRRPHDEALDTPAALSRWLAERGLVSAGYRATAADLREALALREAIRMLLLAQNEVEIDVDAASRVLDDAARKAGLSLRFTGGSGRLEPAARGARGALGGILAEVAEAMSDGSWIRFKACRAEDCQWAFHDTAKNRSRAWCSMSSCGNREKVRAYRARH